MRKSPNLKENNKSIYNSKPGYLSGKLKQKAGSLEKSSYTNRSLINDLQIQTPNQPKKNMTTQASDQKLNTQHQILRSLMKIQSRTNPTNQYSGVKLNFNNCGLLGDERKTQKTQGSCTAHPSPKTKTISLSTYTSAQGPEMRERELRQDKLSQFKGLLIQTKDCLETVRIQELPQRVEEIFDRTIQPLIKLKVFSNNIKNDIMKQIDRCLSAESIQIKSTIESLNKMQEDILSNEFNIIEYMQMGPFGEIMSIYQKKFKEHTIFTQQLAQQDLVITQLQQVFEGFSGQSQILTKQLNQSLQTYLSLYISFQNKDEFLEQLESRHSIHPQHDQLFQTCETNNSIDEDQVIIRENQATTRLPDKTSKFTQLLMSKQNVCPSESPQFKN